MSSVNWQQFGLRGNPYDTTALTEGGVLDLRHAFIGRVQERELLDGLLREENRLALAVCGETGVGKTSLVNYEKYLWKQDASKPLFSFRREIEASEDLLQKSKFLLEIIASVIREIKLIDAGLLQEPIFSKLDRVVDMTEALSISANFSVDVMGYGVGIGGGKDTSVSRPLHLPVATLERYFMDMLDCICTQKIGGRQYQGLIVHINNFDVLMKYCPECVGRFFDDIRDILQTKNVYFLFLGPEHLYSDAIDMNRRVKSVFSPAPFFIYPLGKKEVWKAFEERMRLLQSDGVQHFIHPVDEETVSKMYDLYAGDIRSIMTAISDLLGQCADRVGKTLSVNDAALLLSEERWKRVAQFGIKGEQRMVLTAIVQQPGLFSKTDIARQLAKQTSSMTQYYFPPLAKHGIIVEKERRGQSVYFELAVDYQPLRWIFEMRRYAQERVLDLQGEQASLFT